MAYPIQPQPLATVLSVGLTSAGTRYDLLPYVTRIDGNVGGVRDSYFCALEPGLCTFTLYDAQTLLNLGVVVPGKTVDVDKTTSGLTKTLYTGTITSVSTNYVFDQTQNKLVPETTIQAADIVWKAANKDIANNALLSQTSETQTFAQFQTAWESASGLSLSASTVGSVNINQFATAGSALDLLHIAARGANTFLASSGNYIYVRAIPAPTTYGYLFTDGTHGSTSASTIINMTGVDYGYSTEAALSQVTLNNKGLNRAPIVANDVNVYDVVVPYSATQSIGYNQAVEIDTAVATNNTGWNYIGNTLTGKTRLATASTTYFNYQNSVGRQRNNHGSCRVLVGATYTAGQSINLLDPNDFPDMLTSPAGGTTGNWYFRFYAQAHASTVSWSLTPGIRWYDAGGALLSTTSGTAVNITSTTTWTAINVNAAKPANAVTGLPFFNVGTVNSVGNSFYITDAYFGQQGGGLTYDGDTPDDSSYLYTWTGDRWNSPSQRNTNNLTTLGSNILARNTVTAAAKTVTFNATQMVGTVLDMAVSISVGSMPAQVCVGGVTKNYVAVGYSFDIQQTNIDMTVNLVAV